MDLIQVVVAHEGDEFWCEKEAGEDAKYAEVSADSKEDAFEIGAEAIEDIAADKGLDVAGNEFEIEAIEVDLDGEETVVGWTVEAYLKEAESNEYDYE